MDPKHPARPTLQDIADHLGLSVATVSMAMRGRGRISEKTRIRVEEALAQFGYVYQRSGAILRTSKIHAVGVILNNVSDPYYSTLLASMEKALTETGRISFLCHSNESPLQQAAFMRKMSEYNADGMIISPAIGSTSEMFKPAAVELPPIVFVSRTIPELGFDHVLSDDYESSQAAMKRLLRLGHRKIAFVGGVPSISCYHELLRGYKDALEGASIAFDERLVRPCVPIRKEGFDAAGWLAGLVPRPTAAVAYNNLIAVGLFFGLPRQGLFPGDNFALIAFDDVEELRFVTPPLSAVFVPREEMGKRAVAALVRRIENPSAPPQKIFLKTKLNIRGTCKVVL